MRPSCTNSVSRGCTCCLVGSNTFLCLYNTVAISRAVIAPYSSCSKINICIASLLIFLWDSLLVCLVMEWLLSAVSLPKKTHLIHFPSLLTLIVSALTASLSCQNHSLFHRLRYLQDSSVALVVFRSSRPDNPRNQN